MRDCDACRLKVERALDDDGVFYALKSEALGAAAETDTLSAGQAHLTFELTSAYVDETLAEEELQVVKDHLTGCEQCAMAVDDLRAFRSQVMPGLDLEYQQPPAPAQTEIRWRRFVAAVPSLLPKSPSMVAGFALAMLLLIAAGWVVWQAIERNRKDPKIAETDPLPTTPGVSPIPTLEDAAMVIAQLNDGAGQVVLDGNGKLSGVDQLPPAYHQMIKEALSSQRLEKSPLLAGLPRPDSLLMRGGDRQGNKFSVINPVGIVMLSDRPTFRWSRLEGATGYVVEVYDDKLSQIIKSSQLADTSWMAPQSLKRGRIYSWQVTAIKGGEEFSSPRPPAPLAKFHILDETLANEIVQARSAYASSHLTLALVYTKAGLLYEAELEFLAMQKANPNSMILRRLLASAQAMRR